MALLLGSFHISFDFLNSPSTNFFLYVVLLPLLFQTFYPASESWSLICSIIFFLLDGQKFKRETLGIFFSELDTILVHVPQTCKPVSCYRPFTSVRNSSHFY